MASVRNRLRSAWDFIRRHEVCHGLPTELSIEVTSRCNLRCVTCPRSDAMPRGTAEMSVATFQRIIDQAAPSLELALLHMAGEPLFHPDLEALIDHCASRGVRAGLSTNGTLLDSERAQMLIRSPLSLLVIAIDATDPEDYARSHGDDRYGEVLRNAEGFLRRKVKAGRGPFTIVQTIQRQGRGEETERFIAQWSRPGVDAVRVKRFFNFAGNVVAAPSASLCTSTATPTPRKCPVGASSGTCDPAGSYSRAPCFLLWRQMAFYHDGTAVPCCHDYLEDVPLGNIWQESLAELWNSSNMRSLRRRHLDGLVAQSGLCGQCNQPDLDLAQILGASALDAFTAKRLLILLELLAFRIGRAPPY